MAKLKNRLALAAALTIVAAAPGAKADYAVLRSGLRLHITGYQRFDDHIQLTVEGGSVDVPADDLVAFEPEDDFQVAQAPAPPAMNATTPYEALIHAVALKHGVDEKLITRVIAMESNFNAKAVSVKQALGLMQLMPQTAAQYQVANVFDPAQNIEAGTHYLKDLLTKYRGNLALALAAYNAGPDMVEKYGGVPPFPETESYVRRITAALSLATLSTR